MIDLLIHGKENPICIMLFIYRYTVELTNLENAKNLIGMAFFPNKKLIVDKNFVNTFEIISFLTLFSKLGSSTVQDFSYDHFNKEHNAKIQ